MAIIEFENIKYLLVKMSSRVHADDQNGARLLTTSLGPRAQVCHAH
jgi:hypothetical protein